MTPALCVLKCALKPCPAEDPMTLPAPADVAAELVKLVSADETRHGERVNFSDL